MRFLVVDDHPILRLGVRQLLSEGWPAARIEEARTLAEGAAACEARRPDLVVLDLCLPDASGIDAPARLHELAPEVPILVLSVQGEPSFVARLLRAGVLGYVAKGRAGDELVRAVGCVLDGRRFITADLAPAVAALAGDAAILSMPHERLSAQEYRVMCLIARGRKPAQVAQELGLSPKTVASYRARVLSKGGWASDVEVMKYCMQHRIATPD